MIDFSSSSFEKRPKADALVLPFFLLKDKAVTACEGSAPSECQTPLSSGDFRGRNGEILWLYSKEHPETRIAMLGLGEGDSLSTEQLRKAYASLVKGCHARKLKKLNVLVPDAVPGLSEQSVLKGVTEGLLLANYTFAGRKSFDATTYRLLEKVVYVGNTAKNMSLVRKSAAICEAVYLARDLVNGNADEVTPQYFVQLAKDLSIQNTALRTVIFDKKRLVKERFGLLLAVSQGACCDPALVTMSYQGAPKNKTHIVLVGKGVTYDTGGLNLKPSGSMETMRADMAGAAAVLGAIVAAAALKMKVNVTVIIPTTENSIGSKSYKPGDVYLGYAGKSIEIGNTDAEGRLVLADALAYAVKECKPTYLIDLATLTGAIDVALGYEMVGLFSNSDRLSSLIEEAAAETNERVWRLPLIDEYRDQIKSDIADLKNIGGKGAGSIKGALFLEEFVEKVEWAHLDIAAAAYALESRKYHPKYGTGIGVRLLVELLESL